VGGLRANPLTTRRSNYCGPQGLAIEVATSLPAPRVLAVLERLVDMHGTPRFIRSDNGPEFIALAVRGLLARHRMTTLYVDVFDLVMPPVVTAIIFRQDDVLKGRTQVLARHPQQHLCLG
jgi:hypothetical protein